jgi:hypothetical protein
MGEVSISVPLVLSGKAATGNVFLERVTTRTISRTGARIACKQALAVGDVVAFLLPDQDRSCGARVIEAGSQPQEFLLEVHAETLPFWSMLYTAAQCLAPAASTKPAGDRFTELIRETVEEVLKGRSGSAETPDTAQFEARVAEAMERMWQELGRRFTAAGVTYEKHMNELAETRLAEFEARLTEAIKKR